MNEIIKSTSPDSPESPQPKTKFRLGVKLPLKDRLRIQEETKNKILQNIDPQSCPNRIALILDDSGSMEGPRWTSLQFAVRKLLETSSYVETAYATILLSGSYDDEKSENTSLSIDYDKINKSIEHRRGSSTPIAPALHVALKPSLNILRTILISDGLPNNVEACYDTIPEFKNRSISIDTVFIDNNNEPNYSSTSPKDFMRRLASDTGGIFMTFDNLENFSRAVAYLSPSMRHLLLEQNTRLALGSGE